MWPVRGESIGRGPARLPLMSRYAVAARAQVPPFHVMDLLAAADERQRSHGDLVNLVAGQPMTGAPRPVREEAVRLLAGPDPMGYTVASGIPELRQAIAGHHRRRHGVEVSAADVVVTTGSSGGIPARLPGGLRGRRPGRDGPARLPVLPQRAHRARL